jgi:hypothetical protein
MKKQFTIYSLSVLLILQMSVFSLLAQTFGQKISLLIDAVVQNNPAKITLNWQPVSDAGPVDVFRKTKNDILWGKAVAINLADTVTSWSDTTVQVGIGYEYKIAMKNSSFAQSYICSGIELPEAFYRGEILLVYDTISTCTLLPEIARWISDATGDGWDVIKIPVNQNDAVPAIKSRIQVEYNNDTLNVKSVFILGRVPIPYSGNTNPDGHDNHRGAWPADGYYADMTGTWTDNSVNNESAFDSRNHNLPGDGKFDQNIFPANIKLQSGRVDMRNLPAFALNETQLLKAYLDKNHAYRNKEFIIVNRGLIDDNFSSMSEGFSATGWRSFSAICGASHIVTTDYFSTMKENSYLWSYGCGPGTWGGCSGISGASNFDNSMVQSVFTMLFGSYFGDWDSPMNNFLRSAIANGSALTNCWSGRPIWHFHHMGMGENIGCSEILSMNNRTTYNTGTSNRGVQMALMGDPTLRAFMIAPVQNFTVTPVAGKAQLSWTATIDTVLGYNIYRKINDLQQFEKINSSVISTNFYTDTSLIDQAVYMVRAVKLEVTNSGSFYNMSMGITDTLLLTNSNKRLKVDHKSTINLYPNPSETTINLEYDGEDKIVRIFDCRGTLQKTTKSKTIDISDLTEGVYFIRIDNQVKKFVKL